MLGLSRFLDHKPANSSEAWGAETFFLGRDTVMLVFSQEVDSFDNIPSSTLNLPGGEERSDIDLFLAKRGVDLRALLDPCASPEKGLGLRHIRVRGGERIESPRSTVKTRYSR